MKRLYVVPAALLLILTTAAPICSPGKAGDDTDPTQTDPTGTPDTGTSGDDSGTIDTGTPTDPGARDTGPWPDTASGTKLSASGEGCSCAAPVGSAGMSLLTLSLCFGLRRRRH